MSCLLSIGPNSAYQHGKDPALVKQNSSGSSHACSHTRFPSDSGSAFEINKPTKFGQHGNCAWAHERPTTVSYRIQKDRDSENNFGFEEDHLTKIDRFKSVGIPSNDEQSSRSSSKSLHLPSKPRVPLILPPIPKVLGAQIDKPELEIAGLQAPSTDSEHAIMAESEQVGHVQKSEFKIPQTIHPPGRTSPYVLSPLQPQPEIQHMSRSNFDKEWAKIQALRMTIWSLRSTIHERRRALRLKQLARADAGDRYLQHIRARTAGGTQGVSHQVSGSSQAIIMDLKKMEELSHELQMASDEYGPLEDDCNDLEDTLSVQEFELQRLEKKFYDRQLHSYSLDTDEVPRQASNSSAYSGSEIGQEFHPLVTEYLSKVGDVEILKERLEYHEEEMFNLVEEKATKQKVHRDLAPEDQDFLDTFEAKKRELLDELAREQAEADILKRKCLSQRLIEEDGAPKEFQVREQEAFDNEADLDAGSETSEFVKYPILLPEPGGQKSYVDESSNLEEEPSQHLSFMVNKWLFTQLRTTPLEVNLLARTYEWKYGNIQAREKWQLDVLRLWFSDECINNWSGPLTSSGVDTRAAQKTGHASTLSSDIQEHAQIETLIDNVFLGTSEGKTESMGSSNDDTVDTIFAAPRPSSIAASDTPESPDVRSEEQFVTQMANLDII